MKIKLLRQIASTISGARVSSTIQQVLLLLIFSISGLASAQEATPVIVRDPNYDKMWKDPEVEQRIESGIQQNRKGYAKLRFVDAQGKSMSNVEINFEQTRHDFLFGCNLFMLGGFSSPELNKRYEDAFSSLFNLAVLPFYWSTLEPEQGKPRFSKDSPKISRRPAIDLCVEFCDRHGITPKGHLLMWHKWLPTWLPNNRAEVKNLMTKRFEEIANRYGKVIKYWDVVDEAQLRPFDVVVPEDYVYTAMQEAARIFPPDSKLNIGEDQAMWTNFHLEDSPYYQTLKILQLRNARFDAVGMSFQTQFLVSNQYNPSLKPVEQFRLLDKYAEFQKPFQFTQVTVPGIPAGPEGEKYQAETVRNVYRLWFSHPNVEMINWWNLVDGTAAVQKENNFLPGLLRADLSLKPSFDVLYNLIHKEWWTKIKQSSGPDSEVKLHGFYGDYQVTATCRGKTVKQKIHLTKNGNNQFDIIFQ